MSAEREICHNEAYARNIAELDAELACFNRFETGVTREELGHFIDLYDAGRRPVGSTLPTRYEE